MMSGYSSIRGRLFSGSSSSGWTHHLLVAVCLIIIPAYAGCLIDPTVRLVGGAVPSEGRLEVLYNGTWGTVCNDYFTESDGEVVCRQLGYARVKNVVSDTFCSGDGPIWLDDVTCTGSESTIEECGHGGVGVHNCDHTEDIGIVCDPCTFTGKEEEGAIRLLGGDCRSNGRVEILHNGEWGTVCDRGSGWDINDATVVCRQLGFQRALNASLRSTRYGVAAASVPKWLSNVRCSGLESRLVECAHGGWGNTALCFHRINDALIECEDNSSTLAPTTPPLSSYSCRLHTAATSNIAPSTTITSSLPSSSQSIKLPMSSDLPVYPTSVDNCPTQRSRQLALVIGVIGGALLLISAAIILILFFLIYFNRNRSVKVEDLQTSFPSIDGLESQSEVVLTNTSVKLMAHA